MVFDGLKIVKPPVIQAQIFMFGNIYLLFYYDISIFDIDNSMSLEFVKLAFLGRFT